MELRENPATNTGIESIHTGKYSEENGSRGIHDIAKIVMIDRVF